jgi:hypothetical protein
MLAQHALSVSCFGNDEITPIKALDIPVYVVDGVRYIREKDVPSPLLEAFQNHTLYTVRPFVRDVPDAHNAWDLQFFISRNRNWC